MRINKYLAQNNICSRREADDLIRSGKVKINGKVAKLGAQVEESDAVEVFTSERPAPVYLVFNKPREIITHSPQDEEKEISDLIDYPVKVYPVGRLDKDSQGLIILTNDGRVTGRLLEPGREREKEYVVTIDKTIDDNFLARLQRGVRLDDGYKTKPCVARKISDKDFSIILTEGKKRQIRRMCEALHMRVIDLKRIRIMNIELGNLPVGKHRELKGKELAGFLSDLGLA